MKTVRAISRRLRDYLARARAEVEDESLERWLTHLAGMPSSTQRAYKRSFRLFCARFGMKPLDVFAMRENELKTDDRLVKGRPRDRVVQIMREMEQGEYARAL